MYGDPKKLKQMNEKMTEMALMIRIAE